MRVEKEPIIWVSGPTKRIALTVEQLGARTDGDTKRRSRRCQVSVRRSDPENGRWLFDVITTDANRSGGPYRVRVRVSPHTRNPDSNRLSEKDLETSCSCPAWRFEGPDYWSKVRRYLWEPTDNIPNLFPDWPKPGRGYSDGSFPGVRDPRGRHGLCKHASAVFGLIRDYWAPSGEGKTMKTQLPGVSPKSFWGKLGIPDIRAYLEERYQGNFADSQIAEATAESLNEWYDEPGLFERARSNIRPAEEVMFDEVLREIGRNDRRKTKFLELFEDEVSSGRDSVEEEDEQPEGEPERQDEPEGEPGRQDEPEGE